MERAGVDRDGGLAPIKSGEDRLNRIFSNGECSKIGIDAVSDRTGDKQQ